MHYPWPHIPIKKAEWSKGDDVTEPGADYKTFGITRTRTYKTGYIHDHVNIIEVFSSEDDRDFILEKLKERDS